MQTHSPNMRHEIKLLISYADYIHLSSILNHTLQKDKYTLQSGDYFIRSLYFDDKYDSCYKEKIAGIEKRKKYRIRIYNGLDTVIKLECKEKHGSRILKKSCTISRNVYEQLLQRNYFPLLEYENEFAKEVFHELHSKQFKPSVIVDYNRAAYVHPLSNTRITFDKSLRAGISSFDIFDPTMSTLQIYPNHSIILEVKYDTYIPTHITQLIQLIEGKKLSLSKFCLCKDKLREVTNL